MRYDRYVASEGTKEASYKPDTIQVSYKTVNPFRMIQLISEDAKDKIAAILLVFSNDKTRCFSDAFSFKESFTKEMYARILQTFVKL